ncbi:hypothetical protein JX265_002134 [Neoarthrinium moseri]|uniref:GPI anchored serine-threonine rich protein n=1 Tax=Neoarthrinium moseri TaxID=1658444 RepID=A0A9P9WTP6_9PEZI|nr:uncharacterized protein JN550_001796 [Neoarthrinium moseri]KAI1850238.1 hypothetical protein JX266_004096 [Neoarthrinium moseri]KAI1876300.1 hypothetical protein JN550_001796 [Neoarthrinium moseri]KAI1879180.1 hypothetical protein JX265_002134 [Neoarthrinium moseri]
MKSFLVPVAVLAATVSAQTTTTSAAAGTSTCAAQNILEQCLQTTEAYLALCDSNDYSCLCDKYIAIMTCFTNCPNDPRASSYGSTKQQYCMNASLYGSTTTLKATGSKSASAADATATAESTGSSSSGDSGDSSDSSSGSSATSKGSTTKSSTASIQTGGAAEYAPGMMAAVAGVFAALL